MYGAVIVIVPQPVEVRDARRRFAKSAPGRRQHRCGGPRPTATSVGAAPDEVKSFVGELFALARPYIKGAFVLKLYDIAVRLFEGRILDAAWDAIFTPPA